MVTIKFYPGIKKFWRLLATWGVLWAYLLLSLIPWDVASWKQATLMILSTIGILVAFMSIWLPRQPIAAEKKSGLSIIEFLKFKIQKTRILLSTTAFLILIGYLTKDLLMCSTFFIAGAVAFLAPVIFGKSSSSYP